MDPIIGSNKTELSYEAPYEKKICRLFFFRPLWMIIEMWVIIGWVMWIGIINFLNFWHMLILGERHEVLWNKMLRFMRHIAKWQAYLNMLTDKRPKFIED